MNEEERSNYPTCKDDRSVYNPLVSNLHISPITIWPFKWPIFVMGTMYALVQCPQIYVYAWIGTHPMMFFYIMFHWDLNFEFVVETVDLDFRYQDLCSCVYAWRTQLSVESGTLCACTKTLVGYNLMKRDYQYQYCITQHIYVLAFTFINAHYFLNLFL